MTPNPYLLRRLEAEATSLEAAMCRLRKDDPRLRGMIERQFAIVAEIEAQYAPVAPARAAGIGTVRAWRLHAKVGAYIKLMGLCETQGTFAQRAIKAAGLPCPAPVRSYADLTDAEAYAVRDACEAVPESAYVTA